MALEKEIQIAGTVNDSVDFDSLPPDDVEDKV